MRQRYARTSGLASQAMSSGSKHVEEVDTSTALEVADVLALVDTTAADVDVTLPLAEDTEGQEVVIKKAAGTNNVIVSSATAIDGNASITIGTLNASLTFVSSGEAWHVV